MNNTLVRKYGYITTSSFKINEAKLLFNKYDINIEQLDNNINIFNYLQSSTQNNKILGVIIEKTRLIKRNSDDTYMYNSDGSYINADMLDLELVAHYSILTLFYIKNGDFITKKYESLVNGYLNFNKRIVDEKKYDWDDIFIVDNIDTSYLEVHKKISARDTNLSKMIQDYIHYKQSIDFAFNPQKLKRTIDFTHDIQKYFNSIEQYNGANVKKLYLNNVFIHGVNTGCIFLRSPFTRRNKVYWSPGLNAGIPTNPKPNDIMHELTFHIHDCFHECIPDLIFDGNTSNLNKVVYIAYRLMSEAFTLVLGDMIFVHAMIKDGFEYKTILKRKIYPIFTEIDKKMGITNLVNSIDDRNEKETNTILLNKYINFIYLILKGSYHYCFYQNFDIWSDMMDDTSSLEPFAKKYDSYLFEDFRWTNSNWENMIKTPTMYKNWWNEISQWRKYGNSDFQLKSVSEFISENNLDKLDNNRSVVDAIFEIVFQNNILPIFSSGHLEFKDKSIYIKNSFLRYMMGQSLIFFKNNNGLLSKSIPTLNNIKLFFQNSFNVHSIPNIRNYYENYLYYLLNKYVITYDDYVNYKEILPIFPPVYIDYDNDVHRNNHEYINNILGIN